MMLNGFYPIGANGIHRLVFDERFSLLASIEGDSGLLAKEL